MKTKILSVSTNRREYNIFRTVDQDPYPFSEECWHVYRRRGRGYVGFWRKNIYQWEYRKYRTWKYNRKTQWK